MDSVCIFVVDDDVLVATTIELALEDNGFRPQTAHSAEDGLALFEDNGHICRALVTDVNLGGEIKGWDIARTARERFPTLPVIYVTGDSADEWAAHGVPDSILIDKPFVPAQIVTAIAELLNKRAP